MSFKKSLDDNLEIITVVILIVGLGYLLLWLVGCNAMERINLSHAFGEGIVKQTVEELKVALNTSVMEIQNQMRELLWETFYKITGVGAGGTAAIVGHRYTKSYKNVQNKAVNGT